MERIIVIVGPTASGKSAYAVDLARRVGGEIISADSRQVYRGLDIGTGKITRREMRGIRHHLLDVADPKKVYTAQDFVREGRAALEDVHARGKAAIICGGTGFYIDALLGRISLPDVEPDTRLRARLAKKQAAALHRMLTRLDPRRAAAIDPHNPVRLIRAIEIARAIGRVPETSRAPLDAEWIGIRRSEAVLKRRIRDRLKTRMRAGMIAEARRLHGHGLSYARMEALGLEYRYLARHLRGDITRAQMLAELESEIWKYAKRQMTYWRRNDRIRWITPRG